MSTKIYANIMMIGRTGVGKSSFLNYLLNTNKLKTGVGKPITQGFETLEYDNVEGIPIRVYDSKGLEVKDFINIKESLIDFLKTQCGTNNPLKWIHSIFYCINVKNGRLEPAEIEFINDICASISQTVHIILTNCDTSECEQVKNMERYVRSILKNSTTRIIKVNSVETNNRRSSYKQFGRKEALDTIFSVFWSDIAFRISHQYAKELKKSMDNMYYVMSKTFDKIVDAATPINIIKELINDDGFEEMIDHELEKVEIELDQEMERLNEKYLKIINPLVDFCNNYSDGLGYEISLLECTDFVPEQCIDKLLSVDIDNVLDNSKLGRLMEDMDDIDDTNVFGIIKMAGKMVGAILRIHGLVKDLVSDIKYKLKSIFPSEKEITNEMYNQLMELQISDF